MTASNQAMLTAIENYLSKVSNTVSSGGKPLFYQKDLILKPNIVKTYDVKTEYPTHALYDLTSVTVTVLVLDEDVNSLTKDMYVNSEAVVVCGVNAEGIVKIYNAGDQDITVTVKITAPAIKL